MNLASRQSSEATKHLGVFRQKTLGLVQLQRRKDIMRCFGNLAFPLCCLCNLCRYLFILALLLVNISPPRAAASAYFDLCG